MIWKVLCGWVNDMERSYAGGSMIWRGPMWVGQ